MNTLDTMKQALEAIESDLALFNIPATARMLEAATVLRQAIPAAEKQEPVAWMTINEHGEEDDIHYENPEGHLLEGWTYKPLYTHPSSVQSENEPFEYWNAVEGWVKIDEVRDHFKSVGCGTIYKSAGEGRVPLALAHPQPKAEPVIDESAAKRIATALGWEPKREAVLLRRGDILRCIETDELCTVWATSTTHKTLVKWGGNDFTDYTAEQIGELFWVEPRAKDLEDAAERSDNYAAFHAGFRFAQTKSSK